jgi:hypothetical protein
MNLAGDESTEMRKIYFFDGTNSRFCCKQMTYKPSMRAILLPNERKLKPKRAKIRLLFGREAQFAGRKSPALQGARRASIHPPGIRNPGGRRLAAEQATGVAKCKEALDALH